MSIFDRFRKGKNKPDNTDETIGIGAPSENDPNTGNTEEAKRRGPVIIEIEDGEGDKTNPNDAPPIEDHGASSNPDNLPLVVDQPEESVAQESSEPENKKTKLPLSKKFLNASWKKKIGLTALGVAAYPALPIAASFEAASLLSKRPNLKAAAITAGLATSLVAAHTGPYWHYGTGVSNDVCRITEKTRITFAEKPISWGIGSLSFDWGTQYSTEREPGDKIMEMYVIGTENVPGHEGDECKAKYIEDTDWYLNTDSSDLYADIKRGEVYELKSVGWDRNWLFNRWSWAPNVVHAEPFDDSSPVSAQQPQVVDPNIPGMD